MNTYIIKELENFACDTRGKKVRATSLASAKRVASRAQMFQATVMVVTAENGIRLSIKEDRKWGDYT